MLDLPPKSRQVVGFIILAGLTALLSVTLLLPSEIYAQTSPNLGTSASFAVLGAQTVTNTGPSVINGNLGVFPGTAITGFPPGIVTPPGAIHAADAVAGQAQIDATAAYGNLAGQPCNVDMTATSDLTGMVLAPNVYCFSSTAALNGALTLDAGGNAGAVWIFQVGSTLISGSASSVSVINGGSICNVWWQVGSSATIGTTTSFSGNILALASITMQTGATLAGRALAQTGAVTLDSNVIGAAACGGVPGLSLTKSDGGASVSWGDAIPYTLNYQNTGSVTLYNVTLTETIPANTTFNAGASTAGWNCVGSVCTLNVGTLLPGQSGSAVFVVMVNNPTSATEISNSASIESGGASATAGDTTPVTAPVTVPTSNPGVPTSFPGAPTAISGAPVGIGGEATALPAVLTAIASGSGSGSSPNTTPSAPVGIGLPNTGGGPPQATYWMGR